MQRLKTAGKVLSLLSLGIALVHVALAGDPTLDGAGGGTTKGTIGLVCTDPAGLTFIWDAHSPQDEAFNDCVHKVVAGWNVKANQNSNPSVDIDQLLGGYSSYRSALESILQSRHSP